MTTILWHTADWHTNKKTGVRVPQFFMEENDQTIASPAQRFLWRSLVDQADTIKKLKKKHKADAWVVFGGDIAELDIKKRTDKLHTRNESVVLDLVTTTMEPVFDVADRMFMVHGTSAHVGHMEELVAYDIDCEIHPDTKRPIAHRWLIDVEGVSFMIQHHGNLGRLPWTKGNALNQKCSRLILRYGRKAPDVYIQAHNHTYATNGKGQPILVISAPCMCLPDDFSERIDADDNDIGGLYFVCDKGEILEWDIMKYVPKGITKWSPKKTKSSRRKS